MQEEDAGYLSSVYIWEGTTMYIWFILFKTIKMFYISCFIFLCFIDSGLNGICEIKTDQIMKHTFHQQH